MINLISKFKTIFLVVILAAFTYSCGSDDTNDDIQGPDETTTYDLIVNTTNADNSAERDIKITTSDLNATQKVNVMFNSENSMRRLYIAKSENGGELEPFELVQGANNKRDGSIDLGTDDKKEVTFNIDFTTPSTADGTVTYLLWATTGRGDFRDVAKRNAIGDFDFGTITITAGNGAVGNGVKSFTQTILAAPLGDGSSESFISVLDGKTYKISEGEELASLWDFGYYYGDTQKASLASANDYPTNIINIPTLTGLTSTELNNFFFAVSTMDFDAVSQRSDLDVITTPTSERVTDLAKGDIIEFIDSYGNKGLIKVTEIVSGFGSDGKITFDVKVQTSNIFLP